MRNLLLLILAAAIAFAVYWFGFRPAPTEMLTSDTSALTCPDMDQIQVTYNKDSDKIAFEFNGKSYELPHVVAASGEKYANEELEYWNKGEDVSITLTATPDVSIECKIK